MYSLNDKRKAIISLQRLLNISESGIYDKRTRDSVLKLQEKNGYDTTGSVDYKTFKSIITNHHNERERTLGKNALPIASVFPYKLYDRSNAVKIINAMICHAIEIYSLELSKPLGDFYSETTAKSVAALQRIMLLEQTGEVDEIFIYRLNKFIY